VIKSHGDDISFGLVPFYVGVENGTDPVREVELFDLPSVMAIAPGVQKE
jgi:hypothetical protein